jgi:hypothetical protein
MAALSRALIRHLPTAGRILLGLPMAAFGLIGLVHPMPAPPSLAPGALAFLDALKHTGYMMPMIGLTQLAAGLMLVANRFVPLALTLLAPFFVNSILFHACLERTGLVPAAVFLALEVSLAWAYRGAFSVMLGARHRAGGGDGSAGC